MTPKEMGQVLRLLRGDQPLWQVSAALEMSTENLRHYEAGRNRIVAADIPRFAQAYGVTPEDLARRLGVIQAIDIDEAEAAQVREILTNPEMKLLFAKLFDDWEKAGPIDRRMLIRGIDAARRAILSSQDDDNHNGDGGRSNSNDHASNTPRDDPFGGLNRLVYAT